ncbi:hypothetical protein AXF42_Ash014674 [Apostasia shenzhenica]|uniref:Uncharacterized protein n=1 Tax=Apostasia shenzhenica TaxID=1088818 RepID=A0A2I0AKB4_9ASPA|nr:hypothetical protein AXF42_Ash014674 [Apostasia shenzhenica]
MATDVKEMASLIETGACACEGDALDCAIRSPDDYAMPQALKVATISAFLLILFSSSGMFVGRPSRGWWESKGPPPPCKCQNVSDVVDILEVLL